MKKLFILVAVLFGLSFYSQLYAHQIIGKVVSSVDGLPLSSVQVTEWGTDNGVYTDIDGIYTITTTGTESYLIFSRKGYISQGVEVEGRSTIDITMQSVLTTKEDSSNLVPPPPPPPPHLDIETIEVEEDDVEVLDYYLSTEKEAPNFYPGQNSESYSAESENEFSRVDQNPLSTFSVDVDGASYSNIRRVINNGYSPDVDAVRVEEMINYFNYDYPEPTGETPFSINSELSSCPWSPGNLLLHVGLKGRSIDMDNIPAANIVFLLDVSGSMDSREKLPLLKSSLKLLLKQLRPIDKVAIVVYAGSSGLVLPSTYCNEKEEIHRALENLSAGGSTAGGAGLRLAYKVAEENFIKGGNNRILMATDGDFNVGESSNGAMERLIEEKRRKEVSISVLGFGMGNYKDDKMEIIADKGNGNYAYIDNLLEAKKVLVDQFGGTFNTIAKDVKFQLEFNPIFVSEYRLIGYENRMLNEEDFKDDSKDAGEIGSGHTVTALYEIIPVSKKSDMNRLKYQNSRPTAKALNDNELITLSLRYKQPEGDNSTLVERVVKNSPIPLDESSDNFRFSAAVAEFGMLLSNSKYRGNSSWSSAEWLASQSRGEDKDGYRAEMIRLIKTVSLLER